MYQYFTLIASMSALTGSRKKDDSGNNTVLSHSKTGGN